MWNQNTLIQFKYKNSKSTSNKKLYLGKAYMAPWTTQQENPSMELNVSATNWAFSAKEFKTPVFCAVKL